MTRPRLLDLYCGGGGASWGYGLAGFDVVGVDIAPQRAYPFDFERGDAVEVLRSGFTPEVMSKVTEDFDAIHASPPCEKYTPLNARTPDAERVDLVAITRELLEATGLPWIMENVPGAPMRPTFVLCGSMFGLGSGDRQLRRHRLFESNVLILAPQCRHIGQAIGVYGHGGPAPRYDTTTRGGYQGYSDERQEAMGTDWMTRDKLSDAIPPAYTEYIGRQLLNYITKVDA
jgi:DNA (cytosine-5)-methyltransferase 1